MKITATSTIIAFALCLIPCAASAQDVSRRQVLRGLKGVNVRVYVVGGEGQSDLTQRRLQTDVELRMRKAGVRVGPEFPQALNVIIALDSVPIVTMLKDVEVEVVYGVSISVTVVDKVKLERDPSLAFMTTTWNTLQVRAIQKRHLAKLRENIDETIDDFINDYLAANPR